MSGALEEPDLSGTSPDDNAASAAQDEHSARNHTASDDGAPSPAQDLDPDTVDHVRSDHDAPEASQKLIPNSLSNPKRLQRDSSVVVGQEHESEEGSDAGGGNAKPGSVTDVADRDEAEGDPVLAGNGTGRSKSGTVSSEKEDGSSESGIERGENKAAELESLRSTDSHVSPSGTSKAAVGDAPGDSVVDEELASKEGAGRLPTSRRGTAAGRVEQPDHDGSNRTKDECADSDGELPTKQGEPGSPQRGPETDKTKTGLSEVNRTELTEAGGQAEAGEFFTSPGQDRMVAGETEQPDDQADTEPAAEAAAGSKVKPVAKQPASDPANWPSGKPVRSASSQAHHVPSGGSTEPDGSARSKKAKQPHRPVVPGPARAAGRTAGATIGARLAWQRIGDGLKAAPTLMGSVAAVLLMAVAWAATVQTQRTSPDQLENLSQPELIGVLSDLDLRSSQLAAEKARLQQARDQLLGSGDQQAVAREQARQRYEALAILAGTVPAAGPGVVVKINDPDGSVRAPDLVNAVQELRDAGAEAMQINDSRITVSSSFVGAAGQVRVDGRLLTHPITLKAIGDGQTLKTALTFRGGMKATVEKRPGASVDIQAVSKVKVTAVIGDRTARFARPVSTPSIGGS